MRTIVLTGALAMALVASPAAADEVADDTRCLMVALIGMGQTTEPEKKAQTASAAMFFLGRLDREAKDIDLADRLRREGRGITSPQELGSEARRCADIVRRRGEALRDVALSLNGASK